MANGATGGGGAGGGAAKKPVVLKCGITYNDDKHLSEKQCDKANKKYEETEAPISPKEKAELDKNLREKFPKLGKDFQYVNGDKGYNCHGFTTGTMKVNNNPNFGGMTKVDKFDYNGPVRPGQVVTYRAGPLGNVHSTIQGADGLWYHKLGDDGPMIATHSPDELTGGSGDWTTFGQGLTIDAQYIPK